jgi:hypothetical protein
LDTISNYLISLLTKLGTTVDGRIEIILKKALQNSVFDIKIDGRAGEYL